MTFVKSILVAGFFGATAGVGAADMPDATATVRYLSSYLADSKNELRLVGDKLIYDIDSKCAYDVKVPLMDIKPDYSFAAAGSGVVGLRLDCQQADCMRRFATCDHRVNQVASSVTFAFRADKQAQAQKAFAHLLKTLKANDPFE